MAVTDQELEAAKVKLVDNTNALENIVKGDENTDVDIGGGKSLQTIAKLYKQIMGDYADVEKKANRDTSDGYAGLSGFALNLYNAAGAIKSTLVSLGSAARVWSFPDKSGTVAMTSDITATAVGLGNVDNTPDTDKPISTAQAAAFAARELLGNKAVDFTTVDDVKFPTVQAVKAYVDSSTSNLLRDAGNFAATGGGYPTVGSGTGGVVRRGDTFLISTAGTLGGIVVNVGDSVRAMINGPGQTAANWNILESNIGYVPENAAGKNATNGYPGLTQFKLNVFNAAGNVVSYITTLATVSRTYTMPDKDGTIATTADISATSTGVNSGDETTATILQKLGNLVSFSNGVLTTVLTGLATGTAATIAATDTVLQALSKLQAQLKAIPFDIMSFVPAKPAISAKLIYIKTGRALTIPANMAGSKVKALTVATAATTWTLTKNGASAGTITWAAGASVPTLATAGGVAINVAVDDELLLTAASTQDAGLADIGIHILATVV